MDLFTLLAGGWPLAASSIDEQTTAGHMELDSDNYVEVSVDVGVVMSHLFSPASACGMLCELTLNKTATLLG